MFNCEHDVLQAFLWMFFMSSKKERKRGSNHKDNFQIFMNLFFIPGKTEWSMFNLESLSKTFLGNEEPSWSLELEFKSVSKVYFKAYQGSKA